MAMTEKVWRVLAEFAQENESDNDRKMMNSLAAAVSELNLPSAFLERLQTALAEAVRKAFQHHDDHAGHKAVSLRVMVVSVEAGDTKAQPGWGFFLIEKGAEAAKHTIELFLYQDGR